MKKLALVIAFSLFGAASLFAQADKKEVRRGNSDYKKSNYKEAEIHYRKAALQDSTSFAATYDLAGTLYQQKDYEGAANTLSKLEEQAKDSQYGDRYYFNKGNVSLQKQDYKTAVEDFRQALLRDPSDMDAKESYIYAKKKLENQQNGGGGQNDRNDQQDQQDQDNKDNQDNQQNQDQNQDQNQQDQQNQQNQNQDQQDQQSGQQQISKSQAQQMLKAIQAQEKETQEKVEKAKAEKAKTRQKDKNW